jgi:YVTN family beta-propeller protein
MPVQVGFAPDSRTAYVSLNSEDAVAQIDVAAHSVTGRATTGRGPLQVFVTPDGQTLLVANQGTEDAPSTTVSFIDTSTLEEVAQVESGQGAHGVAIEPSGRYAYVTNLYEDSLAVVDIATREVVATVPTGAHPNGVSFLPGQAALSPAMNINLVLPDVSPADHEEHHDN